MPVYPIEWRESSERGDYPHMARHDATIWERFLAEFSLMFSRFAYDVALGGVLHPGDESDLDARLAFQYGTACKVDALGERAEDMWVIEVKPDAHAGAVGQALVYYVLAQADKFTTKPLVPVVVTNRCNADIKHAAAALGVTVLCMDEPQPTGG